jgi:hypothetical protein
MGNLDLYEIVKKLNGPIIPIGETNADNERSENLNHLIDLTDKLIADIMEVAKYCDRQEYSMMKAGSTAYYFLKNISDEISYNIVNEEETN